jgi:pSer/pThr/pTyr-binding forkhead associated (FHA) protein
MLSAPFIQALVVGRGEEGAATQPDIDMTPAGAVEAGVSRFHARFELRQETLFIEDLGSTNGTRINGVDLIAGKSYRLMAGDEIELGSLRLSARVVR